MWVLPNCSASRRFNGGKGFARNPTISIGFLEEIFRSSNSGLSDCVVRAGDDSLQLLRFGKNREVLLRSLAQIIELGNGELEQESERVHEDKTNFLLG